MVRSALFAPLESLGDTFFIFEARPNQDKGLV